MTKQSIFKSWIITNLIGSISIILIIFITNLILKLIDFDFRRLLQVGIGIVLFFIFGIIVTLPHYIYSQVVIDKDYKTQILWGEIWKSMLLPYLILIVLVVAINLFFYGNPIYELPNLLLLGILILHFVVGFFVWRYYKKKIKH